MSKFTTSLLLLLFCAQVMAQDLKLEVTNHAQHTVCEATGAQFRAQVTNLPMGITISKVELLESSKIIMGANDWDKTNPWRGTLYFKKGQYTPILRVTFSDLSQKTIGLKDTLEVLSLKPINLDASVTPGAGGCINNTVAFSANKGKNVLAFVWSFGDGIYNSDNAVVKRTYSSPGSYSVDFSVLDATCSLNAIDTTIAFVNIGGPKALIHHPEIETGHAITKPTAIPLEVFRKAKATGKPKTIQYEELRKVSPYAVETYDVYHGVNYKQELDSILVENSYIRSYANRYEKVLINKPTSSQKAQVMAEYQLVKQVKWRHTDPLPSTTAYQPGFLNQQYKLQEYAMPDTMIYGSGQPNFEVQFTNFSTLFRPSSTRTSTYEYGNHLEELKWRLDSVKYPSFPYAGDTLQYFWNFNDPSAKACTSTVAQPDASCAYSTEKLPKHTYAKPGCFSPSLTVTDPKTGCSNTTSIQIINQTPDAGWDIGKHGNAMSFIKQKDLENNGVLEGLGLELTGAPCAGNALDRHFQTLDISGTLPSCGREDFWVVFDAENDCDTIRYKTTQNGSTIDTFSLACEWLSASVVRDILKNRWSYTSPGWKSVGLVIKSGENFDTTFYRNYKYIVNVNADFHIIQNHALDSATQRATFNFTTQHPDRTLDSITSFNYKIVHEGTPTGKEPFVTIDSLKLKNGGGILKNLSDTFFAKPLAPGKYRMITTADGNQLTYECNGVTTEQFWVGHFASLRAKNKCFGDTTYFFDSIFYWRDQIECDLIGDIFNYTCTDREMFFKEPSANATRKSYLNMSGYSLPSHLEKIAYDFENDGVIDFTYQLVNGKNVGVPKHVYPKPGKYTCALWTRDSLGSWQKDTFPVEISGISNITVERENEKDSVLYCLPNIYRLKTNTANTSQITRVRWFLNDKHYTKADSARNNPFFNLTSPGVQTIRAEIEDDLGCKYTLKAPNTRVVAPTAKYIMDLPKDNCAPLQLVAKNKSQNANQYNWLLNGSSIGVTTDLSDFTYTVAQSGKYNLLLQAQATYITSDLDTVQCLDVSANSDSFSVRDEITSAFSVDKSQGLKVQFNDKSTNAKGDIDWYFYDGTSLLKQDVSTAGNPIVYTFPSSGDYRICQIVKNENCVDSSCQNIWVAPTGIVESSDGELMLFPNPNTGRFIVHRSSTQSTATLSIFNAAGKQVWIREIGISESNVEVNTPQMAPGVYILKMTDNERTHSAKLMIE